VVVDNGDIDPLIVSDMKGFKSTSSGKDIMSFVDHEASQYAKKREIIIGQ
jgi:hypothetical protein